MLGRAHEREIMRTDIPRFQDAESRSAFLTCVREDLVAMANSPGLLRDALKEIEESADPRVEFHFPWAATINPVPPSRDCQIVPLLRFPSAFTMASRLGRAQVVLPHNGAAVQLEREAGIILGLICESPGITIRGLVNRSEREIPSDNVLPHISELLKIGLVTTREPAGGATLDERRDPEPLPPPTPASPAGTPTANL
jgi:hypothetical protein